MYQFRTSKILDSQGELLTSWTENGRTRNHTNVGCPNVCPLLGRGVRHRVEISGSERVVPTFVDLFRTKLQWLPLSLLSYDCLIKMLSFQWHNRNLSKKKKHYSDSRWIMLYSTRFTGEFITPHTHTTHRNVPSPVSLLSC